MISEQSKQILSEPQANTVVQGDCIEVMRWFRSRSVDLVLTDPHISHTIARAMVVAWRMTVMPPG